MSRFVIYNVGTEQKFVRGNGIGTFETIGAAKISLATLNKKYGEGQWKIMDRDEFIAWQAESRKTKPVKMKKVTNLMSGIEIEIAEDTPRCCDPSTELYWAM